MGSAGRGAAPSSMCSLNLSGCIPKFVASTTRERQEYGLFVAR